jgi:stage II sporulation protein M
MHLPQIIRQKVFIRNFVLATSVFFVSIVLGTLIGQNAALEVIRQFSHVLEHLAPTGNLSILFFLLLFINNAIKTLGIIFLGILLGVPPLLFIGLNGFVVGSVGSALESVLGWRYVIVSVVPHGVIEMPFVLLATALGLTVGMESLKWLLRRESRVKLQLSDCFKIYLRWILPGIAVAAIIEAFVTPLIMGLFNVG